MNLDKLRSICLSFPGATEGIKWGHHICFMVAEKIFCVTGEDERVTLKVTPEEFEELTGRGGITQAPYMAKNNSWITVERFSWLKAAEWKHFLDQSYHLIRSKLPKKVQAGLK